MTYEDLIRDFAERTRRNLEFIDEQHAAGKPVYEITQLVNSMLGLLVFPQQSYFRAIPEIPIAELERAGWPRIRATGGFPDCANLRDLVRLLRNAITHFNLRFIEERGEIVGLTVWNVAPSRGQKTWQADLSLDQLRDITRRFIEGLETGRFLREDDTGD